MPDAAKSFHYHGKPKDANKPLGARGNTHSYGAAWDKFRKWYADEYPPICVVCDCSNPTMILDHIRPLTSPDDPGMYDETNLQWMCRSCHGVKCQQEKG